MLSTLCGKVNSTCDIDSTTHLNIGFTATHTCSKVSRLLFFSTAHFFIDTATRSIYKSKTQAITGNNKISP